MLTSKERISTLDLQVGSKDTKISAKLVKFESVKGSDETWEAGASALQMTIRKLELQLCAAQEANFRDKGAFQLAECQLQRVNSAGLWLHTEVS